MLALVGEAYGASGGIAQYNRDFFEALAAAGDWSIRILPRTVTEAATPMGGVVQDKAVFGRRAYAMRATRVALAERPDVVFCGHLFMAPLAHFLCGLTGARLIIQLHGIEGWEAPNPVTRKAVEDAELVLCVSRDTRAKLLSWSAIAPERAVVLANTVRDMFTPGDRAAARDRFGLDERAAILSVSRLDAREAYKGQDRVIRALPTLAAQGLQPLYLIAGEGDDLPRLQALTREAGVQDQVRFLGKVADADLPDLYRAADLFALPSTGEGFGIVYLEAMACGTPALGLRAGGAPDALCDGELGTLAEEADLARAIAQALAGPPRRGLAADVRRRFGREVFTGRLQAIMVAMAALAVREAA